VTQAGAEGPRYVERGGELVYSPPGVANGVRMWGFFVEGDPALLQQMFDRYLNLPSNGATSFEPAGSLFAFVFATLDRVFAQQPPDVYRGYFKEAEFAIWTLGYDRKRDEYATFVPYMVVDQGSAMAMGREVYGFPKQLGKVHLSPQDDPTEFTLHVPGVKHWGEAQRFEEHRLVRITKDAASATPSPSTASSKAELVTQIAERVFSRRGLATQDRGGGFQARLRGDLKVLELMAGDIVPMVFLKQIRDARMPLHACYQAIQLADFVVWSFRGGGSLEGEYTIELEDLANEPIRRELGLPAGPIVPHGGFWADFDFTLAVTENLWTAPSGPPPVTVAKPPGR
jgi:Acetoacetate decarboxylase (ADC)